MKLREWQAAPAERLLEILRHGGNAVDLSDTGTGKTYVACAVAAMFRENTVAVVPKIAVSSWLTVAAHFDFQVCAVGYEAMRTGRTPFGRWENPPPVPFKSDEFYVCESCQCKVDFDDYRPCHCHTNGTHCIKTKKQPWKYGKFIWNEDIKLLIFDEVHRCSGLDSLNADMLIAAKRQGIRVLGLSATAACTPLQMRALGFVLDLHGLNQNLAVPPKPADSISWLTEPESPFSFRPHLPTFYQWAAKHDCRPDPVYRGLRWFASTARQKIIMADLHKQIVPGKGVRVRTSDIPDFPERQIETCCYDLEKDYEIRKLYNEMESALDALSLRTAQDVNPESAITAQLRLRMRAELLKIPILVELAEDELAKGKSVAVFCNFTATLEELSRRLRCGLVVDGSPDGVRNRDDHIARFQRNEDRLILLNSAAGGISVSLQDLTGAHPRVGLISPSFSAVEFRQVCGRLHRAGAKSPAVYKVVLVANTVEEKIKKALDQKLNNLDSLTDGDLLPI